MWNSAELRREVMELRDETRRLRRQLRSHEQQHQDDAAAAAELHREQARERQRTRRFYVTLTATLVVPLYPLIFALHHLGALAARWRCPLATRSRTGPPEPVAAAAYSVSRHAAPGET